MHEPTCKITWSDTKQTFVPLGCHSLDMSQERGSYEELYSGTDLLLATCKVL